MSEIDISKPVSDSAFIPRNELFVYEILDMRFSNNLPRRKEFT